MADMVMEPENRELEKIGEYVRSHLDEWIHDIRGERELDLIKQVIRVEEELKNLQENMDQRFEQTQKYMDQRFEQTQQYMDKQFAVVNQRFEQTQQYIDRRLEQTYQYMDQRFTAEHEYMDRHFEAIDRRFVSEREYTGKHFEVLEKRLDFFEKGFSVLQWTMGLGFTILAVLMGVFNFF